jgi:hypothetical protein
MAHDVFISYSAHDKPAADAVCVKLESRGIRCWTAPRDIRPGMSWGSAIVEAIDGARVMLLLFSSHANGSPQISREVERAVHKEIIVLPVRVEDVSPTGDFAYFLSTPHWLDAITPPFDQHLDRIADSTKFWLERVESGGATVAPRARPARVEPSSASAPPVTVRARSRPKWIFPAIAALLIALVGTAAFFGGRCCPTVFGLAPNGTEAEQRDAPIGCNNESALHSLSDLDPATISFSNSTESARNVYWLNYAGKRVFYQTLAPGGSCRIGTYLTHPWVITDANSACVAIYRPAPGESSAIIDR